MYIDIVILSFIILMLVRGIITGAFRYLYLLLAMICALFIAHNTAPQVAVFLNESIRISLSTGYTAAALAIWTASTIILRLCFSWLLNPVLNHFLSGTNRLFGALAGLINGTLLAYLLLWGLVNINNHFPNWDLMRKITPEESIAFNLVRENNYINDLNVNLLPKIQQFGQLINEPQNLPQDVANNENMQNILHNGNLMQKLKNGEWGSLLGNNDIRKILLDPKIINQLEQIKGAPAAPSEAATAPSANEAAN